MEEIKIEKAYSSRFEVIFKFLLVVKALNGIKIGEKDLKILVYPIMGYQLKNINTKEKIYREQKIKSSGLYTSMYRLREAGLLILNEAGENIPHKLLSSWNFEDGTAFIKIFLTTKKEENAI